MATHLIFDLQGAPHLATETPDGFLSVSGVIPNSEVRFACPVAELEKRVRRFGAGDEVYDVDIKGTDTLRIRAGRANPLTAFRTTYTIEGGDIENDKYPPLIHLSEAQRLGLISEPDETE